MKNGGLDKPACIESKDGLKKMDAIINSLTPKDRFDNPEYAALVSAASDEDSDGDIDLDDDTSEETESPENSDDSTEESPDTEKAKNDEGAEETEDNTETEPEKEQEKQPEQGTQKEETRTPSNINREEIMRQLKEHRQQERHKKENAIRFIQEKQKENSLSGSAAGGFGQPAQNVNVVDSQNFFTVSTPSAIRTSQNKPRSCM